MILSTGHAHPVDTLIGGIFPTFACLLVLKTRMHIMTLGAWLMFKMMAVMEDHSGLEIGWSMFNAFPMTSGRSEHFYHHFNNDGNYGSFFTVWDRVFGTKRDDSFTDYEDFGVWKVE